MWLSITCYIFFYYPCTFLHLLGTGLTEESGCSLRGGPEIRDQSSASGVLWARKDGGSGGRIRGGGFLWASEGSNVMFLHNLSPISPQESLPHTICHPPPQQSQELEASGPAKQALESTSVTVPPVLEGEILANMQPLHIQLGGIKRVYRCQVEGCREGPSTSHATICAHIQRVHLVHCAPSAVNLFSIHTLSDTTKKSFKCVNRGSHVCGSVNLWWVGGSHFFLCISSIIFICIIAHLVHLVIKFCIFVKLFKFYKEILYIH